MGAVVIVENIPDRVDIHIESLIKREITQVHDTQVIKFCRKQLTLGEGFRLILLTNLVKPRFDVNLTNYATVVNFAVSVEGLS